MSLNFNFEISYHRDEKDENLGIAYGMGMTAEKVAQQWGISRDAQDEFALNSHKKAIAAQQAGEFNDEITPFTVVKATPDLSTGEIKTSTKEK